MFLYYACLMSGSRARMRLAMGLGGDVTTVCSDRVGSEHKRINIDRCGTEHEHLQTRTLCTAR